MACPESVYGGTTGTCTERKILVLNDIIMQFELTNTQTPFTLSPRNHCISEPSSHKINITTCIVQYAQPYNIYDLILIRTLSRKIDRSILRNNSNATPPGNASIISKFRMDRTPFQDTELPLSVRSLALCLEVAHAHIKSNPSSMIEPMHLPKVLEREC